MQGRLGHRREPGGVGECFFYGSMEVSWECARVCQAVPDSNLGAPLMQQDFWAGFVVLFPKSVSVEVLPGDLHLPSVPVPQQEEAR